MKYDSEKLHRRSIRLKNYDYSSNGAYFITLVTKNRDNIFGEIINGEMNLNNLGDIVFQELIRTSEIRENIILDEFVIMPNHFHCVLFIDNKEKEGRMQYAPTNKENKFRSPSNNLGSIIRGLKSSITKRYLDKVSSCTGVSNKTLKESIWERNYYEHIIRNENALNNIRKYIKENPIKWSIDRENKDSLYEKYKFKSIQEINDFNI